MTTHATEDDHSQDDDRAEQAATSGPLLPEDDRTVLSGHHVAAALLEDWRYILGTLRARFTTGDFATGLRLVRAIGEAAEEMDHHPDLDLRYPTLDVTLVSHDVGGLTMRDVRLARQISDAAGRLGVHTDTASLTVLELAIDTADLDEIRPFWAAVLGYDAPEGGDDLVDTSGRGPALWFQETDAHEAPRQRFHLDIAVPPEHAEARVRAAVEAGGTVVSDGRAPAFWVLADAQGNQACVCTWLGRDHDEPPPAGG